MYKKKLFYLFFFSIFLVNFFFLFHFSQIKENHSLVNSFVVTINKSINQKKITNKSELYNLVVVNNNLEILNEKNYEISKKLFYNNPSNIYDSNLKINYLSEDLTKKKSLFDCKKFQSGSCVKYKKEKINIFFKNEDHNRYLYIEFKNQKAFSTLKEIGKYFSLLIKNESLFSKVSFLNSYYDFVFLNKYFVVVDLHESNSFHKVTREYNLSFHEKASKVLKEFS
jgi:hypothetical protein